MLVMFKNRGGSIPSKSSLGPMTRSEAHKVWALNRKRWSTCAIVDVE
jgi:hypothetical protein